MFALAFGDFSSLEYWLAGAVLLLLFVIWVLTRHQECSYAKEPAGEIKDLLPVVAGLTHGSLVGGNDVCLVRGPDFFERVVQDLDSAVSNIHLETYLWKDGKASNLISEALVRAARRGVTVRILADARGTAGVARETKDKLREAGCQLYKFHRWRLMNLGRFNIRDHRKIVVIDGRIAYVGGHCITDAWLEDQEKAPVYRDLTARLTGPIVNNIQSVFSENWTENDCEIFVSPEAFPQLESTGGTRAHVAYLRPDGCPSSVQILHYVAIALAKKSIRIQNPYFLPDPAGAETLARAARRGVDVRIMTPAVSATDSFFVAYAGHFLFENLLEAGVRIFEYQPTLIHQKTITIDGEWCGIGSCNFDDRSFEINDEVMVGLANPKIVEELERIFEHDMKDCEEVSGEVWKKRSIFARSRERLFYLFNEQF